MLFMLSDAFTSYKEPTFFLFKIDENIHTNKHLFTEVRKSKLNERIIAQKGAFLNFDKIFMNKHFDVERICCIKIRLNFSEDDYLKHLESEEENIKNIQTEVNGNLVSDEQKENYLKLLENEKNSLEKSKLNCLQFIKNELLQKLREFCYFEEDLFPDFETRIKYLSGKYKSAANKKILL